MSTEEQVRKAAARYRRWKSGDFPNAYKSPYFNCDGDDPAYIDRDRRTLADAYIDELSRRESERAERAKPIDAEWCLANGAEQVGDCNMYRWKFCVVRIDWDAYNGTTIDESDGAWVWMPSITARGQLLALLAALKGGAT